MYFNTFHSVALAATDYTQDTAAVGGSQMLTALVGITPLIVFFVLLMVVKLKAHWSALGAVAVALLAAMILFHMPAVMAMQSLLQGVAFGLFPVVFIIWMAVWLYDLTVHSQRFEDLKLIFSKIGRGDMRVQALLIGFSFGGLMEALAGFGAPVAIVAAMLFAIGLKPMKAVLTTLVANTAPVAFGAMAIPVTTAGLLANLQPGDVAGVVGRQVSVIALIVPFILCVIMDGLRGLKQVWPMALVLGISFGAGQFLASNFFSYELTDVVACLVSLAVGVGFLRIWAPTTPEDQASLVDPDRVGHLSAKNGFMALFPYLLVIVVFATAKLWTLGVDIPAALSSTDLKLNWPVTNGHLYNVHGELVSGTVFTFNWLSNPGTLLFICGVITGIVYSVASEPGSYPMSMSSAFRLIFKTFYNMRFAALTIAAVMGLAYVMNFSGQTAAIGAFLAGAGALFPLISPVLGFVGTAVTGSATSANALFAQMQAAAAKTLGVSSTLLVGANTTGAVLGKMLSPQTLAIAATAVNNEVTEAQVIRNAVKYSIGLLLFVCVLIYLQSTPVLGWMIPTV